MNLLDANDRRGSYPASWYAASTDELSAFAPLRGETKADLCVIGGGYTGLSAALHAAQSGLDVVLLDAQRVGFGASGRNGGQVGSGFNKSQAELEKLVGFDDACKLYEMGQEAVTLTQSLIAAHAPEARYRPGLIHADRFATELEDTRAEVDHLRNRYGNDDIRTLDTDEIQALIGCPHYVGGALDMGSGHIHPLRYALGLARACIEAGVRIFELSRAHDIAEGAPATVRTDQGFVVVQNVIVATNGYGTALTRPTMARVMPINNFIVATEPLGARASSILSEDYCAHDSRFVVNYYRLSEDGRLLFGGGENYGYRFPTDIASVVRKPLEQTFPQLKGVGIEYAWGGTLAVTMSRLPHIARPVSNILSSAGYSGHGVALAGLVGKILADATSGQSEDLLLLENLPTPRFPGGGALRSPLLALAMTWYALRDRIGV